MTGLQKQIIPVNFAKGMDTKTDKKQLVAGALRKAENIVYETLLSLRKRNGYDYIDLRDASGVQILDSTHLSKFKNELVLLTEKELYGFSESLSQAISKGSIYTVQPTSTAILANAYEQDSIDSLYLENLSCFVHTNTNLDIVSYSVLDNEKNTLIVGNATVDTSSGSCRVGHVGNYIYIFYAKDTELYYRRFSITTPSVLETAVLLASDVDNTAALIDCLSLSTKVVVAYNSSVALNKLKVFAVDTNGDIGSILGVAGADASSALDITIDSLNRIFIAYANTTAVEYVVFPFNLNAPILIATVLETVPDVVAVSGIEQVSGTYKFLYTISDANVSDYKIRKNTGTVGGVVGTPENWKRSIGLAAKQFWFEDEIYVLCAFQSELQTTYFLLNEATEVILKLSPEIAGQNHLGVLTHVSVMDEADKFLIASQRKSRIISENGTFFSVHGAQGTVIDFSPVFKPQTSYMSNNLIISGGVTELYDGSYVSEAGFNVWPEGLELVSTESTGGNISDGTRFYVAVYKWTDNSGQDHFSAESEQLEVVYDDGGTTQMATISVPTLRLTKKQYVVIELYGTENAGTTFYKVTSNSSPVLNDETVDAVEIDVTVSDADLISKEVLYTTGGVLENIAPPSASIIATVGDRVVLAGLEEPNTVQFSKAKTEGRPVEFSDELVKFVNPLGGNITAIADLSGNTIIFEESACFYIAGEGPNNTGEQNNWTEPELISSDVGCVDPTSVVLTPVGLMFKSSKGIYLMNGGLGLDYVGAPMEEFNNLTITSAKIVGDKNQVRFTTSDGQCLVYNYHVGLWATFTNHEALSAETILDDYFYLRQDGSLYKENSTSFADNGSPIKLKLETGWMSMNQLQGFQRVYKFLLVGEYKSAHNLRMRFAYDFNEAFIQEKVVDVADFIDSTPYGGYSPYGMPPEVPYGGKGIPYQLRVDLKKQKCQTIKISIEDMQSVAGEGFSLSALTFQAAGKTGLFKVNRNQKFGSS